MSMRQFGVCGGDGFGGPCRFYPAFERADDVELIGAGAAAAVHHAGDHEETIPVVLIRAHVFEDDSNKRMVFGGDGAGTSVVPTVIHEELAAAGLEG